MVSRLFCVTIMALLLVPSLPISAAQPSGVGLDSTGAAQHAYEGRSLQFLDDIKDGFFIPNMGQISDPSILFYSNNVFFTSSGVTFSVVKRGNGPEPTSPVVQTYSITFEGAARRDPIGRGMLGHRDNFIRGSDPSAWVTDVPSYSEVVFEDIYDNIDLEYRWSDAGLKYEFLVMPGGDPSEIAMRYAGADLSLDGADLLVRTPIGDVIDGGFLVYQLENGAQAKIASRQVVEGDVVHYDIGEYDPSATLVIDPLVYSTFLGGNDWDDGLAMATDGFGNVYLAGSTYSYDFPTSSGAYCTTNKGDKEVYVTKLSSDGKSLEYSTYIGGQSDDIAYGLTLDASGNVYLTGETSSTDFPIVGNVFNKTFRGGTEDAFILKLNPTGNALVYSSFIGGKDLEIGTDVAVDPSGNAYIIGQTWSSDFPVTTGAFCMTSSPGTIDGFVSKVNPSATALMFSTYIAGKATDYLNAIEVDGNSDVYLTGETKSTDFPITHGSYMSTIQGGWDAFVTKLNSSGDQLLFSTFLGASSEDSGNDIKVDQWGNVFVLGYTLSTYFPTTSVNFRTSYYSGTNVFISKLSSSGKALKYSALIGGDANDYGNSMALIGTNEVIFSGYTFSEDYPVTPGAFCQTNMGVSDIFLTRLNITNDSMVYSTGIGGKLNEDGGFLSMLPTGEVAIAGTTYSRDFPTTVGTFDTSFNGGTFDAFALKFRFGKMKPGKPSNLTGVPGANQVLLTWEAPTDKGDSLVSSFNIYRWEPGIEPVLLDMSFVTTYLNYGYWNVDNGVDYSYAVAANNEAGTGEMSDPIVVRPGGAPDAPYSLNAESAFDQVNLTWKAPPDNGYPILNYTIYRGLSASTFVKYIVLGNVTSYVDLNITNGIKYYYEVTATNFIGESRASYYDTVLPSGPPKAPMNFTAVGMQDHIELKWDPPLDNRGYIIKDFVIYRGENRNLLTYLNRTPSTIFVDYSVKVLHTYYYQIRATNEKGQGDPTEIISATQWVPLTAPNPMVDLAPGKVMLSWNAAAPGMLPLLYYRIHKGTTPSHWDMEVDTMEMSYNDTEVTPGVTYYYALSCVDKVGDGNISAIALARAYGYPGPPTDLLAKSILGHLVLTWKAPGNDGGRPILGYTVFRGTTPDMRTEIANVSGTTYEDFDVMVGTKYYYSMTAYNVLLASEHSSVLSANPMNRPGKIANISVEMGDAHLNLRWNPPSDTGGTEISYYDITRWSSNGGPVMHTTVLTTAFSDYDIVNGRTYHYSISAVNDLGTGDPCESRWVTPGTTPDPPISLKLDEGKDKVIMVWTAPMNKGGTDITSYVVYRGESPMVMIPIATVNGTWYIDRDVEKGATYYYKVAAVNDKGEGRPSIESMIVLKGEAGNTGNQLLLPAILVVILVAIIISVLLLSIQRKKGRAVQDKAEEHMEMDESEKKQEEE